MADTVNVLGKPVNKKVVIFGGLGAAGVIAIVVIRKRSAGSASAAATTSAASGASTDPAGNTGVIDPATGYVYGSPEDEQALSQSGGFDTGALGVGDSGSIDPNTGGGTGVSYTSPTTSITTREQWIEAAEADLNAPSLGAIAANVFANIGVSAADKDVFLQAVAIEGQPPGGYPNPIKTTDTAAHPAPGKPAPKTKKVPGNNLSLREHAGNNHLSMAQIVAYNPALLARYGTDKKIPDSVQVTV